MYSEMQALKENEAQLEQQKEEYENGLKVSKEENNTLQEMLNKLTSDIEHHAEKEQTYNEQERVWKKQENTLSNNARVLEEEISKKNEYISSLEQQMSGKSNQQNQIVESLQNERTSLTMDCLLYTSPSPRDKRQSRMPSSA